MALTDNLISFWSLEEASGTRIDAVTATGNDLTDVNTVTSNPGIVGTAGQFTSANSEKLTHASNASLSLSANELFTWNVWAYFDTVATRQTMISKYGGGAGSTIAYIVEKDAAANFRFLIGNGVTNVTVDASTFGAPTTATWYMITCQKDATTAYISVNNGAFNSLALSGTVTEAATFEMGSRTGLDFMNGRIDQVGFWKRVLSAAEITQLYNGGAGLSYAQMQATVAPRYGSSPAIRSLGLISAGATATQLCTDTGLFCAVVGFQWVSGTVTIGSSTVTAAGANAYCNLDTTSRVKELRYDDNCDPIPVKDIYAIGSGTFICYYQVH